MKNHRPESTDEQLEHHSLPGTNMAGKGPAEDCERRAEQDGRDDETGTDEGPAQTRTKAEA